MLILLSLILVFLNGFFVASEFAIVKVRRTRLEELVGKGIASARISLLTVDQLDIFLTTTQFGITLVSLLLGWIGEHAFFNILIDYFPQRYEWDGVAYPIVATGLAFFSITLLHVVLGELVPKSMAIQDAERITLFITPPLRFFHRMAKPIITFFQFLAGIVLRLLGYTGREEAALSENELKLVMKESKEEGVISDSEAQIIARAFEFSDKRVEQIMVSADKVSYLSLTWPLERNLEIIRTKMHTRFPLCKSNFQDVVGTIHMKDVWPLLLQTFSNEAFEKMARPSIFVSSNLRQDQLLKLFQSCRAHQAVVRDTDNRNNVGIVTMEDVLEELVGEIRDEHGN